MAKAKKLARKVSGGGWTPAKRSAAARKAWVSRKRNAGVKSGVKKAAKSGGKKKMTLAEANAAVLRGEHKKKRPAKKKAAAKKPRQNVGGKQKTYAQAKADKLRNDVADYKRSQPKKSSAGQAKELRLSIQILSSYPKRHAGYKPGGAMYKQNQANIKRMKKELAALTKKKAKR